MYPEVDDDLRVVGEVRGWKLYERIASEITGQAGAQYGVAKEEQINTPCWLPFVCATPGCR